MSNRQILIRGTFILTLTGLISRATGFFYRIFLTHAIGAEEIGIYQLLFPFYGLCFAFCVSGIQTALSRLIAARLAARDEKSAYDLLCTGTVLSLFLSLVTAISVHHFAPYLAVHFLKENRTIPLLRLLSYAIPFGTLHICICSYYFACRKTAIPSFSQLLEQLIRISASLIIYTVSISEGIKPDAYLAVAGILAGECASSCFSILAITLEFTKKHYKFRKITHSFRNCREILHQATPLTANRLSLSLLHSLEATLIPLRLQSYGMSVSESLSVYGILTGMTLPLILFPSAITSSVSTLLLPTIAKEQASGNRKVILHTIQSTIKYCLIMGIFIAVIFFTYGNKLGFLLFHNTDVGALLKPLSFICPFLYLNGTLASILNGLGKSAFCFLQNLFGTTIRLFFTLFIIPLHGVTGCLWGFLFSELLITALSVWKLHSLFDFSFPAFQYLCLPTLCAILSLGGIRFFLPVFNHLQLPEFFSLSISLGITCIFYGLFLMGFQLIHFPSPK